LLLGPSSGREPKDVLAARDHATGWLKQKSFFSGSHSLLGRGDPILLSEYLSACAAR
jgi:hypothetical protein